MSFHQTSSEYNQIILLCKTIFEKKHKDYGSAWRILRLPSITDQIYIKARRIRAIQEAGVQRVKDDIPSEFIGIINYCVMALMQIQLADSEEMALEAERLMLMYNKITEENKKLLENKNHDYGEAWRLMRISSMTDLILMKLLRIKQIEDNQGKTLISEGVDSIYSDIINYAVFCLIKLEILNSYENS
ncbi:MAG: DUF1599 domain-containing protein [Bacteroidia bacterium]|nr:DUF1599 domain-containing protein [Bacteroidia bacterium]